MRPFLNDWGDAICVLSLFLPFLRKVFLPVLRSSHLF